VKRVTFREPIVESEQANSKVAKVQEELPLCNTKSQPRCPLGLTSWQERKLKRLSAEKLKSMNMAWVPKGMPQGKVDVQPPAAVIASRMKEERTKANKLSRQRFPSYKRFRSAHHSYYSATPFMPVPWNSYSGMIGYPHGIILIHGRIIIVYIMKGYYQTIIHLISCNFVTNPVGRIFGIHNQICYFVYLAIHTLVDELYMPNWGNIYGRYLFYRPEIII
jgi:hypothetical protein